MLDRGSCDAHPLMQDRAFAAALGVLGQDVLHLPNGQVLLTRRIAGVPVAMLPRAAPPPDFPDQLRAVGWHRRPVILSPETPCVLPKCIPLARPRQRAVLTLLNDSAAQLSALHGKWRNQLRLAEKSKLKVSMERLLPDLSHPLLTTEVTQSRARGYANWPASLTAAFASVAPAQTHLFSARIKRKTVAQMLFMQHGAAATYHIGHSAPEGRELAAHNLLLWTAMMHFAALGCIALDLGLLDKRTQGLNRFKLRTGAESLETAGSHLYWRPFARG